MRAVSKKEVVPKKTVRKATVRTSAVVAKKAEKKKVVSKTTALQSATSSTLKPKKRVTKKEVPQKVTITETVFVPSTASIRLLEKAELYRVWYKNNFPVTVARVAQIGGYVFIFAGTLLASATYLMSHQVADFRAAVVCTEDVCTNIADDDLPAYAPLITFNNSIPELIGSHADIEIGVQNTQEFKMYLKNLSTGIAVGIDYVETLADNKYRYVITTEGLSTATYELFAETTTPEATYKFSGPKFSVISAVTEIISDIEVKEVLSTATTTVLEIDTTQIEVVSDEEIVKESPVVEPLEDIEVTNEDNDESEAPALPVEAKDEELVTEEELTDTQIDNTDSLTPITATIDGLQNTRYLKINTGTLLPLEVGVYSQVESSEQPLYLGLATLVQGEWIFSLAALQLPSVSHLLYASFDVDGLTYRSEGVPFAPTYNDTVASLIDGDISILVQKTDLALQGNDNAYLNRQAYFSDLSSSTVSLFERTNEEQFADGELLDLLDEYMTTKKAAVDAILAKHAHVSQVGKKYLLTLSSQSVAAQAGALSQLIAEDIGDKSIIPTLNTVLTQRYLKLRELVAENESRLNQDTSSLTSRDSDDDGISDYDELVAYSTNPSKADTDLDGVLDAVEIITGSDPLVSDVLMIVAAGAVAEDVVFDEVVSIEKVEPHIVRSQETQVETVQALVFGKGIKNSYVYIVSPTLGTVGVIQTNDTGVFSYTLEKGVTDGHHEIYAVLTDAKGTIVASSKPRVFTKSQNTFVAAAVGSQNISFETTDSKMVMQFSTITTALGVVALGLILLLLMHALRSRPKVLVSNAK